MASDPYSPIYDKTLGNLESTRKSKLADILLDKKQMERQYGYGDTSNPYSRAKLLEQSYQTSRRGTGTSMAAQGQLYSGALQNAQDTNLQNYSRDERLLKDEYSDMMAKYERAEKSAQAEYDRGVTQAGISKLDWQLNQRPEDPGPAQQPQGRYSGGYKTVTKWSKKHGRMAKYNYYKDKNKYVYMG